MFSSRKTAAPSGGYNLTKSLRFRSSASAYLNRTPSASNQKTWTISFWAKRGLFGGAVIFNVNPNSGFDGSTFKFNLDSSDDFGWSDSGASGARISTNQVFRDPSAWYHIIMAVDTTQATASNRYKLYVNGSQVTSFNTSTYPTLNSNTFINGAYIHQIGRSTTASGGSGAYFDGEMTEFYLIDGQQLTASSFGSFNSTTGVWQPAQYTGTYGTNGFYLPFTNTTSTSTLGNDFSGNGNTWTVNNISLTAGTTYDSMTDVPTLTSATVANYATLNPLNTGGGTYSNGNLQWVSPATDLKSAQSTIALNTASTGKWYWEVTCVSKTGTNYQVMLTASSTSYNTNPWLQYRSSDGVVTINGSSAGTFSTFTTGDVIGVTFDASNSQVALYKNNTLVTTQTISNTSNTYIYAALGSDSSGGTMTYAINFGQQGFLYTPPTGFVSLNTYNLPTSTIVKGNTVMNAVLYTGNGSAGRTVTGVNFQPDFTWIKSRSDADSHYLVNNVAGYTKYLLSNSTQAEVTNSNIVTSSDSDGFTVGSSGAVNGNTATYVSWNWKANGSTSSNTSGSITSTVSVNATAGFSIVTYTGTGSNATVGHGLGVAPSMVIVKSRSDASTYWCVYQSAMWATSGTDYTLLLPLTNGAASRPTLFNSTQPSSTVFSIGTNGGVNNSASTYVAYCWSEIAGFSKFGSYTGNGSTDGPFSYTGFRPRFVMTKRTDTTSNWYIIDTSRSTYNVMINVLAPNLADAEDTGSTYADCLSNGFKIRTSAVSNASGGTYLYMAFAENPFKNALAR